MPNPGLQVGVAFGGRSVEHDVSILTGLQALEAISERHEPVPLYLDRSGRWLTGPALRRIESYQGGAVSGHELMLDFSRGGLVARGGRRGLGRRERPVELDVVVAATHGTHGEDGSLQGLLELAGLPYAGPPVAAAAVAMDKVLTKRVLASLGLPLLDHAVLGRESWRTGAEDAVAAALDRVSLPVYVKPAALGSSVGVSRCADEHEVREALELVFELDRAALVEPSVEGGREVNCAVLGRPGAQARASVCEQPVASAAFLSFEDKYLRGDKGEGMKGAERIIPAPLDDALTARVQELAVEAFTGLGCAGVARVDLLLDADGRVYVNECNTIPGSFSFYLWEPAGLSFPQLMDELIDLALAEHGEKARTTRTFDTNLLASRAQGAKR